MKLLPALLLFSAVLTCSASAKSEHGKILYSDCAFCHQEDGSGNELINAPAIGGQESWYLELQLHNFKNGIRGTSPDDPEGMDMAPRAKSLKNDNDIKSVASYISNLKPEKIDHKYRGGNIQRGKRLYTQCIDCHGSKAEGNPVFKAPRLNTLNDWYILKQLKKFKAGLRGAHPEDINGSKMIPVAKSFTNEQAMKDVIAYIKTL